jgi:hypothetical protein
MCEINAPIKIKTNSFGIGTNKQYSDDQVNKAGAYQ